MDSAILVTELRHRLGITEAADVQWCPQCNGILDTLFFLCRYMCGWWGKILRHTAVLPFANGWTGQRFNQAKNVLAFFSHSGRKILALNIVDLPIYICRASTTPLLRLTWPSRPHSDRRSWDRQLCRLWRQLLNMLPKRGHTSTRPTFVLSKGFASSPWWPKSTGAWDREAGHILLQISRSAAARTGEDAGVLHGDLLHELCPHVQPPGTGSVTTTC